MRKWKLSLVGAVALAATLTACEDDYLSGPELTTNPNLPTNASISQLFNAVQVRQFIWHAGDLSRSASMFVQQMAGTDRQYIDRDQYNIVESDFSGVFSNVYAGGGLVDIRQIQQRAEAQNDQIYLGIGKILEGWLIGTAASLWGDIPYSEAVGDNPTPSLDEQQAVYAQVQQVLTEGINALSGSPAGTGPGRQDLVYGGDRQKWTELAHTLKARFYMHWVEAQLAGGEHATRAQTACGGNCIELAHAAAQNGISAPANNYSTIHRDQSGEKNPWFQFVVEQRQGYISAGQNLVELLRARNDPRLTQYFAPTAGGQVVGAPPASSTPASTLSATRLSPSFRQPLVTYAENQLILAETNYRLGNQGQALQHLNNVRQNAGLSQLSGISGPDLLREIAHEYYISLFQQIDAWNVYQRLCMPVLTPPSGQTTILGRLLYGEAERNVNPNIPAPAEQPARNKNDPNACQ